LPVLSSQGWSGFQRPLRSSVLTSPPEAPLKYLQMLARVIGTTKRPTLGEPLSVTCDASASPLPSKRPA
jgi:hypothetical protein